MNVLDFFKKDTPTQYFIYPSAQVNGVLKYDNEADEEPVEEELGEIDDSYAEDFRRKDDEDYRQMLLTETQENTLFEPEELNNVPVTQNPEDIIHDIDDIFTRYEFAQEAQPQLVMNSYQDQICSMITAEQTIVIQGPTGCGKSTQVPQFILNMCKTESKYCRIAVTQPRRIAAVTVTRRVCEERGWPLGTIVGYKVGLDSQTSEDTIITYMTTGVLLQQLVTTKNMSMYTHIILDEVHERDQELDFLMLIVRKFSRQRYCRTKIILMSATFDTDQFAQYFGRPKHVIDGPNRITNAVVLDVVKPTAHTVNVYYLDQLDHLRGDNDLLEFDSDKPVFNEKLFPIVHRLLEAFDNFDINGKETMPSSVLIFLPGLYEIEALYESLKEIEAPDKEIKWLLLPLHSSITVDEQKRAFEPPPVGHRKIILSTNIAESSVTVPDVVFVIDFCLTKLQFNDPLTGYSSLQLSWASHINCNQRKGRVGRVRSGRVYRLVYNSFYEKSLPKRLQPEMLRCPLHRLVLLAKRLDMGPPHAILALAMDSPNLSNIKQTVLALKEAGALLLTTSSNDQTIWNDKDGDITPLGTIMSYLPLSIHSSRLVVLGHMFGMLKETIIMASAMSLQNIFSNPFNQRMRSYMSRLSWSFNSYSDLITYMHVYNVWEQSKYSGTFRSNASERAWMTKNYLQPRTMREWKLLVQDITQRLARLGIRQDEATVSSVPETERAMILKIIICGAFYPNYFVRNSEGGKSNEKTAVRELGGRDPFTTVYFRGKPTDQPGQLYVTPIRELLKGCGTVEKVSFDSNASGKVYVQFTRSNNSSSRIAVEVLCAIKYRQLKLRTTIPCLSPEEGIRRLNFWRQQRKNVKFQFNVTTKSITPPITTESINFWVCHVDHPNRFYIQSTDDTSVEMNLNIIFEELNNKTLDIVQQVKIGKAYAAPYQKKYYRAKVTNIKTGGPDGDSEIELIFVDFGNREKVYLPQLRELPKTVISIPPLTMQCTLTNIRPAISLSNQSDEWPEEAIEFFKNIVNNTKTPLYAMVFSVVDGVSSLEMYKPGRYVKTGDTINELLIQEGYARNSTESFLSNEDHERRERAQMIAEGTESNTSLNNQEMEGEEQDVPPPPARDCRRSMMLRGPHSPLEMQIRGITNSALNSTACVEHNSINSVLLDSDPQDPTDVLLVAGMISKSSGGSHLTLRHTSLMPHVHGFPALMAMLWAPRLAFHTDKYKSRITSVLCGLGCNPESYSSRFHSHDMVFNFDFDLEIGDVEIINEIREYMNQAMEAIRCYDTHETPQYSFENCQSEIRLRIRTLMKKSRDYLEKLLLPLSQSWKHAVVRVTEGSRDMWPPIPWPELSRSGRVKMRLEKNIEEMKDVALRMIPMSELTCHLCQVQLYEVHEVQIHLVSKRHLENVKMSENLG